MFYPKWLRQAGALLLGGIGLIVVGKLTARRPQ